MLKNRVFSRIAAPVVLVLSLFVGGIEVFGQRGVPAEAGVGNFGKINDRFFRGAQPDAAGITNLARLGIKKIINLRMANDCVKSEASEALAQGILYTNVPLRGLGRPTDEQVCEVLEMIDSLPGPVFLHCKHGCDRTGTIVACY